jgi:hypothetical protein
VNPAIPEDSDYHSGHGEDDDPLRNRHRTHHGLQALRLNNELGCDEADIQHEHAGEEERRSVEAELAAALDRLWHAELRPLGRMQRNEQGAEQGPDSDGDQGPPEREPDLHHHRAQNKVEDVAVGAPPERELVPGLTMPRTSGDHVDVVVLHISAQLFAGYRGLGHGLITWAPFLA